MVLPDSGPTESLHARPSCTDVSASVSVVSTPSAVAPTPAAMIAAEIGPSTFSLSGKSSSGPPPDGVAAFVGAMSAASFQGLVTGWVRPW